MDLICGLHRYDAVSYLKYLDSLRASENIRSVWIFAESSYKIFEYAKKRVYHFVRLDGGKLGGQNKSVTNKKRKLNNNKNEGQHFIFCVFLKLDKFQKEQ